MGNDRGAARAEGGYMAESTKAEQYAKSAALWNVIRSQERRLAELLRECDEFQPLDRASDIQKAYIREKLKMLIARLDATGAELEALEAA